MDLGLHTIACPNCGTSYQLPAGAIGPKGRRLVCSVCQTDWRAMPGTAPAVAIEPAPQTVAAPPTAPTPSPAMAAASPESISPAPARAEREVQPDPAPTPHVRTARAEPAGAPATATPPQPSPERLAQMAEIRQMLAELKHPQTAGPDDGPPPMRPQRPRGPDVQAEAAPTPQSMMAQPGVTGATDTLESDPGYDDEVDPLRARLAQHNTKAYRPDPVKNPYDRAKLMRKHDRKIRRRRLQDNRGSGAFVTGFLLMIMVAAGMTAIYILHPQIIARFPGAEKPLLDYVATIDGVRVSLAQTTADVLGWINSRLFRE